MLHAAENDPMLTSQTLGSNSATTATRQSSNSSDCSENSGSDAKTSWSDLLGDEDELDYDHINKLRRRVTDMTLKKDPPSYFADSIESARGVESDEDNCEEGEAEKARKLLEVSVKLHQIDELTEICELPKESVYCGAIVMPMIAMNSRWRSHFVAATVKMFILVVSCASLQLWLLSELWKAKTRIPSLDGTPHVCTYGQDPGCIPMDGNPGKCTPSYGPLGLEYSRNRENVEPDHTMLMVRNTLYVVLSKLNITNEDIGPVEYGMESPTCRLVCLAVLLIKLNESLYQARQFIYYLYKVKGKSRQNQCIWVKEDKIAKEDENAKDPMERISYRVGPMPWPYKWFFAFPLVVVRCVVLFMTYKNGIEFLMDTAGIVDLILDNVALVFIDELDKWLYLSFVSLDTKRILSQMKPFQSPLNLLESKDFLKIIKIRSKKDSLRVAIKPLPGFVEEPPTTFKQFAHELWKRHRELLAFCISVIGAQYLYFFLHCDNVQRPFLWTHGNYFEGFSLSHGTFLKYLFGEWKTKDIAVCETFTTRSFIEDLKWFWNDCNLAVTCNAAFKGTKAEGCGLPEPFNVSA